MSDHKKIVVVGDGCCGKTCLLVVFVEERFPIEYIPTVFENHIKEIKVDNAVCKLYLMDTAGQEDYRRLRKLQYQNSEVFVVCFAVDNRDSFLNVTTVWMKELRKYNRPIVLVATKCDLRLSNTLCIAQPEGLRLAKKIKAAGYFECSAKLNQGVREIFEGVAKVILKRTHRSSKCNIM